MFGAHSKFAQALVSFCGVLLAFATSALCLAQGATPTQTTLSIAPSEILCMASIYRKSLIFHNKMWEQPYINTMLHRLASTILSQAESE